MNDIRALLALAARRLETASFLWCVHWVAVVPASLALLLMLADRAGSAGFVPWIWVVPLLFLAAVAGAVVLWSRKRRSEHQVALAVDARLDLAEKMSTALYCAGRQDPFAQAAIEDAVHVARSSQARELARRRFAVRAPRGWWIAPLLALLSLMAFQLPQLDLLRRSEVDGSGDAVIQEARRDAETSVEALVKQVKENKHLESELQDLLGELTKEGFDPDALKSPEQIRREAIKRVSELNRRLEDVLGGEKSQALDSLQKQLATLRSPEDGAAKKMAEALAKADFQAAGQALKDLMDKLQKGDLDDAQKEALAEQMKNLAQQLEQLAQQQGQLADALRQAGMDPALANNAQALQQALENNQNLNQQQIEQLKQLMNAQQQAAQMCQGLGQACQQMAQAIGQGQMGQAAQGAQQMGQQLDGLEQLQLMLQQAQAACNACQGKAQGLGQGLSVCQGNGGMGQRGQGSGGKAPIAPTPWGTKLTKADIKSDPGGEIIARTLVDGSQYVGESRKAAMQIIAEKLEGYEGALTEETIPPQYKAAHLHYFGELQKMTEAKGEAKPSGESETKPSEEEAKPSEGESKPSEGKAEPAAKPADPPK